MYDVERTFQVHGALIVILFSHALALSCTRRVMVTPSFWSALDRLSLYLFLIVYFKITG
jgi:hypothetical protein